MSISEFEPNHSEKISALMHDDLIETKTPPAKVEKNSLFHEFFRKINRV
jgi:hypothetical protein